MKKFLKDTRGVVMMEYIILGCFAVAITLVAVLALGKAYNNGLATMGWATLGASVNAVAQNANAGGEFSADVLKADAYAGALAQGDNATDGAEIQNDISYQVYKDAE